MQLRGVSNADPFRCSAASDVVGLNCGVVGISSIRIGIMNSTGRMLMNFLILCCKSHQHTRAFKFDTTMAPSNFHRKSRDSVEDYRRASPFAVEEVGRSAFPQVRAA